MNVQIEDGWKKVLGEEFEKPYFHHLTSSLKSEKKAGITIFPPGSLIFNAFNTTPFDAIKVVILGQDPYHRFGQAHGLCFSVQEGIPIPPSLINIFKEIKRDLGIEPPLSGNLTAWAKQGILLLNAVLTVRTHEAASHANLGWMNFTDAVIQKISTEKKGIVFLLWGKFAQSKESLIDAKKHFILKAAHPSPLSASNGFIGCKHFSQVNHILTRQGKTPIDWDLKKMNEQS
ncbi:MAG: uracil-DNA glycosylase [Bacteroidetes bacterium]|nr:uracil-DNA glycosylase [Bacteroidota bacterium]